MVFFYPKTVETKISKINGEIRVVKLLNTYRIVVGGYTQSGGLIEPIWKKALQYVKKNSNKSHHDVLILGLGAGTSAQLINQIWPNAYIVGIEIDPHIISLAKKYFKLSEITNLDVIKSDAFRWLTDSKKSLRSTFDLILVDMYVGEFPPVETASDEFLMNIKQILTKDGIILFNRLMTKKNKADVSAFKTKITQVFPVVKRIRTPANVMLLATSQL